MVRYAVLLKFTDQGLANVTDSPQRAEAFRKLAADAGAEVESQFWTLGEYDGAMVFNAPDEATAVALTLRLGRELNVKTEMLRAFGAEEFTGILQKVS